VKNVLHALGIKVSSTGKETLEIIKHPFAQKMIIYKSASWLLSHFIENLKESIDEKSGRGHATFQQIGSITGRVITVKPKFQEVPKEQQYRNLFIAPPGYEIITADYSQIELRILAYLSKDKQLLKIFNKKQDLHRITASKIFKINIKKVTEEQRDAAKRINFAILYGRSPQNLSQDLNISVKKANSFINNYFDIFPGVKSTLTKLSNDAMKKGYAETLLGRKMYLDEDTKKRIHSVGKNYPVQGTCADIIKKAIFNVNKYLKPHGARIINTVHDELVIECKKSEVIRFKEVVDREMKKAASFFIDPVRVEVEIVIGNVWQKK
ncbi:MAG: hypothetical protein C0403_12755, partial [Desulfobacterium sp.]|nr:hypothetical protein [Desulfobacterium sp.]